MVPHAGIYLVQALLVILSLVVAPAVGEVYYISPRIGNDDNDGSMQSPFKTVSKVRYSQWLLAGVIDSTSRFVVCVNFLFW